MRICPQCQAESRPVKKICRNCGYRLQGSPAPSPYAQRNREIATLYAAGGTTYAQIASRYGISSSRVAQIYQKGRRVERMTKKAIDYSEEIERVRQAWNEAHPNAPPVVTDSPAYSWVERVRDDSIIVEFDNNLYEVAYTDGDDGIEFVTPDEWVKVERTQEYKPVKSNALKAISSTDDELIAANYIIMFGDEDNRDLEGIATPHRNADGTVGEFFTKATRLDSAYTATGQLLIDWEHGEQPEPDGPGRDDILGVVNWKSARVDDRGVWVERVLDRHNAYMKYLEILMDQGIIGTSSEALPDTVKVKATGEITDWGLRRDTLTVMPTQWQQKWGDGNVLQAMKGLASIDDAFKSLLPEPDETPEPEPSAGDAGASREVELAAKAGRVEAERILIEIEQLRR